MGVSQSNVSKMIITKSFHPSAQIHPDSVIGAGNSAPEYESNQAQEGELKRLKAELKRVTQERDILKEAAVFFENESKKNTRL